MNLGDLFFTIRGEGRQLEVDAKKAGDKAGQTLGQRLAAGYKKGAKDIGKGFAQGAGIAGVLGLTGAVTGLVSVLGDAFAAFREEQASVAKLDQVLEANVESWDGNRDAIEKVLASRLALGYSDDEQRDSLASLITRTKDATKALELQRLAMDLSRLRGIDLAAASDLVGKAYSGQVGALRKAGIAIDKNATSTEALAALQKAAAGQAEAYAETSEGKMAAAQIAVGEAMEQVGAVVNDVILFFIEAEKNMNTAGAAIREGLGTVGDVVQDLLQPLADLNDAVGRIPGPWHDAAEAAEADALRIRQAAVDAAVQAALAANKTPDAVAAALREEGRGAVLQAAAETLGDPIPDAVEDGKEAAKAIARLTVGEIAEALRGGRSAWQEAVDQLGTDLENELTRSAEIAQIRAELAGDNIARGLASKDPIVKAQAEATRLLLTNRLAAMEADARHEGEQAGDSLAAGLRSRTSTVAAAAAALARAGIPNIGAGIGDRSGDMFGGYRAAGGPVTARRSYIVGERGPELFRPGVSGDIIPAHAVAALGESGGSQTINNNVTMHGVALRKRTPFEVAQEMERFERIGLLGGRPKRLVPDY